MRIETRTDGPGIEITGADLRQPPAELARRVQESLYAQRVVVIRNQELAPSEYLAWSRMLGRPQVYPIDVYNHPEYPEIYVSSNLKVDGKRFGVARTGYYWHTDCSFLTEPVSFTMLYLPVQPKSRRETLFVDMTRVLRDLDPALRDKIASRWAIHGPNGRYKIREQDVGKPMHELLDEVDAAFPKVRHPCTIKHPVTGVDALYVNDGFTVGIEGLSDTEARPALKALFSRMHEPERVEAHVWRPGDVLIWDNRQVIHRSGAAPQDEEYVVLRISIFDGLPFYETASNA